MSKNAVAKALTYHAWPNGTRRSRPPRSFPPGVWVNTTPTIPGWGDIEPEFGFDWITNSASEPGVFYGCCDQRGLWRSEDYMNTWVRLGTPPPEWVYPLRTTGYLDSPLRVFANPADGTHLIATQGVRGATQGFWVSRDRGVTWAWPQGFIDVQDDATNDVTTLVIDPTDFNHILIGSHSGWGPGGATTAGIMRTTDGGETMTLIPAEPTWPGGSLALAFLYDPATSQGNSSTWLVATDGDGLHRTTDAGANWDKVSSLEVLHGGGEFNYMPNGDIYGGGDPYPLKSSDNGENWTQVTQVPSAYYYTVKSNGSRMYTQLSNTGDNAGRGPQKWWSAPVGTDDWEEDGTQEFNNGPYNLIYDAASELLVGSHWNTGIWAMKKAA